VRRDVLRVPFPEIHVLGHPCLAAALLVSLARSRSARHRHPVAGTGPRPGDGVVGSDEPGRPAVAGSHSAVGEATFHAFAQVTRAGADHSVGADNRTATSGVTDKVLADHALAAGASATGADRITDTAGAAGAAGEAAHRNRIGAITGNTAQAARIGPVAGSAARRTGIAAARDAAGRKGVGAVARHAHPGGISGTREAAGR